MKKSSVSLNFFRRHIKRPVATMLAVFFPLWSGQLRGATLSYDGSDGPWDLTTTQWDGNSALWVNGNNLAFFGGTPGIVTLSVPITAGGLIFGSDAYTITADTLTLLAPVGSTSPAISVAPFTHATIESTIAGTSGLTKLGNGTLFLSNNANSYTGDTVINAGAVVITNEGQLGASTGTISINGIANSGNPGYTGGQLVVNGVSGTGPVTMNREISVSGRGPGAVNGSGGLVSVGNNTFNGDINLASTASEARFVATHGITTVNGDVLMGGNISYFMGNGNFIVNGQVSGLETANDRFIKSGNIVGSTLWLTNANNDFRQTVRPDSGTIRVSDNGALGTNTSNRSIDFASGGFLEIHTDAPNFDTRNVYIRNNINARMYATRAFDGSGINETIKFGNLTMESGTLTFDNRNGFNFWISAADGAGGTTTWTSAANAAFTNNADGRLTFDGSIRHSEGTARTFTVGGNGNTRITGSYLGEGGGAHVLTKSGNGIFWLEGTASTYTGATNVNAGTLSIGSFGAINNNTAVVNIGATTVTAALEYTGAAGTLTKTINLAGTTGGAIILSNGTGPVTLAGTVTATGAGIKTLTLGGTNAGNNLITGAIPNNSGTNTTSLLKFGAGTWALSGANTYTGSTTITNGILALVDTFSGLSRNVMQDSNAITFGTDLFTNSAGGTFAYLGDGANASTESVGALIATAGAGTVAAVSGSGGTASLIFSSLGTVSAGSGINFVTDAGSSITLTGAANINGILNAHLFYNGADFASGSTVAAAAYTLENTGTALLAGNTTPYLINTTDILAQVTATINAGIKFEDARSLILGDAQILTINNGGAAVSGGILVTGGTVNVPVGVTIGGGAGAGITSGGASDLVFRTDGLYDTLTLNAPVLATTTGGWTKLGDGTLILGAANANTTAGFVTINDGTVQLMAGAQLGANGVDVRLRQGATLDLNGVNLGTAASNAGSLDILEGAGDITNSAAGTVASLRVGEAGSSSLFTGTISDGAGQIALVKNGAGSFRLQGAQTYSGGVTINGGNLYVTSLANFGSPSGLGTGDATLGNAGSLVFNGGTLFFTGSDGTFYQQTDTPSVSIDRLFTLAGNGTIYSQSRFGGPNRENVASGATLIFNNPGDVAFSGAGARTLTLRGDSNGDNEINLRLTNNPNAGEPLSILKSDASLWILTNTGNDYTGNTSINGGVLRVGNDQSALTRTLPTTSALVLGLTTGSGVLQTKGLFDRPLAATATAGGVTWGGTTGGGGFAASTEPLVVNLGGAGDTLKWGVGGFVGTGGTQTLFLNSNTSWADVDFRNGIDLNGGTRTIQVDDNGFTGLDYATISGVISNSTGTGSLDLTGGGTIILGDANTYNGNTRILSSGSVFVTSIGNESGTMSSSFGASGGSLSFAGNATQQLLYVGAGETASRPINFTTALSAARTYRIDSSGSGALVLSNLNNNTTGNFALFMELRGTNTDGNMITSALNDGVGALAVVKADGGVWILNPSTSNSYSGGTRIDGGLLGVASGSALGAVGTTKATTAASSNSTTVTVASTADLKPGMYVNSASGGYGDYIVSITNGTQFVLSSARTIASGTSLVFGGILASNAGIFATDPGGLTLDQSVVMNNNTAFVVAGSNDITLNGHVYKGPGANDNTISNNLENGAVLTVNGDFVNLQNAAATRVINVRGYGSTVWNGVLQNFSATSLTRFDIRIADNASFTLGGANTLTGGIYLGQGTLIVNNVLGLGPTNNEVQLNGGRFTSLIDLTGANAIQNLVRLAGNQATISGSQNIELAGSVALLNSGGNRFLLNELDTGKTLTISGRVSLSNDNTGRTLTIRGSGVTSITGIVQNGGTGAGSLAFSGLGSLELTNAATATGALTVNRELVILSGPNGSWNFGTFTLNPTGIIRLDNSGGNNPAGRLSNAGNFLGQGGTLDIIGFTGGSSHSGGALVVNSVQTYITIDDDNGGGPGTAPVDLTFSSLNFANSGSSLNLIGVPSLGTTNKVLFGTTAGSANPALIGGNIMSRVFIGSDFATYDVVNGVKAFTGYDSSNSLAYVAPALTTTTGTRTSGSAVVTVGDTTGITPFMAVTGAGIPAGTYVVSVDSGSQLTLSQNATSTATGSAAFTVNEIHVMDLTANVNLSANSTRDALKINGSGLIVGGSNNSTLTLTGAAILNTGGNNTLSIPQIDFTTGPVAYIQVVAGTTLDVNSTLIGGNSWAKTQAGTLNLNTPTFITGTTNILSGTVVLNGGLNTMYPNQLLNINNGATLDLNGNVQFSGYLLDPGVLPGTGGSITTTGGPALLVANQSTAATVASVISGAVSYAKLGSQTLTLESVQTYTGTTTIMGGTLALQDEASISNTSSIEVRNATLSLNNNSSLQISNPDRISDTTPIALRDGTLIFTGRVADMTTETLGVVTVFKGSNTITANTGGVGSGAFATAQLNIDTLIRNPGTTINFTGTNLGSEGTNAKIIFANPLPTVANGAIGAWAIANTTDYAAYNQTNGVGVVGNGGFVGYDATFASGNITEVDSVTLGGAAKVLPAGTTTTALLHLAGQAINNIEFTTGGDILNLELGGILRENNAFSTTIGTPTVRGVLTAGGNETSGTRELVIFDNTSGNPTFGGGTINVGTTVVTMSSTVGLLPGMTLTNGNFPAGTTIVSVDSYTQLTLSNASTNSTQQTNQTFTSGSFVLGTRTSGSNLVSMNSTVGIVPGMSISGTGIPAGAYVVSVDSATDLTLSQNATASLAGTATFTLGMGDVIVNSAIADNGFGNSVSLVKSGAGTMTLTSGNTYTGGTTVAQGTLRLQGGLFTTVVPAGGLQINNAVVTMVDNSGQIDPTNIVTLTGSSTLTLAGGIGADNTLNSIVFDNTAGTGTPTVSIPTGSVLTLTSSSPVTVKTNNALTLPTISGGTLAISSGVNTVSVEAPNINGTIYTGIHRSLNISSVISGVGSSIAKTGDGLMQLSGQSTFTGGITVSGGGIVLGTSSTGTVANLLVSGPLGIGGVSMAAGTRLFVDDNSRTVANAFSFVTNPVFSNIGTTTDTMTLNGALSFATLGTTGLVANIDTPYLNVVLGGAIAGIGSVTGIGSGAGANTINKTGLGNIIGLNLTGISNTATINLEGLTNSNVFTLLHDGDGTSSIETINLGTIAFEPVNGANLSLTIGRAGSGLYFPLSAFKTIALTSLNSSVLPNGITLANNNNYGLDIPNNITLASGNNWTVNNANTSLQPAGLVLSGVLSGTSVLTMSGNGVLKLGNAANSFTGTINITNGTVEAASDGAFGDPSNVIQIGSNSLAEGLRISGTFATSREINLSAASSGIDVTGSNIFTLNNAFTFATAANALRKNDLGTLVLTQAQPGWDGILTIGQGVLRIMDGAALGTTTGRLVIGNVGASLELPGGITVNDDIQIASTNNSTSAGVNVSGAIHGTGGTNTINGLISIDTTTADSNARAGTLTADLGSILNVTGGVVLGIGTAGSNRDNWVGFGGAGTINLTTAGITYTGNLANGFGTLSKFGAGTLNIQVANAMTAQRVVVKSGLLSINGAGSLGVPGTGGGTGDVYLNPTGILTLDNSGANVNNRLGGRNLNVSGADLNIIGNSGATTSETVGLFTLREGSSFFTLTADAAQQLNFTTGTITRSAQATLIIRGSNLGAPAGAGVATIKGGAYPFIGQLGATETTNKAILPWAFGDTNLTGGGSFFLTSDSVAAGANTGTNILRPLTAGEQTTDLATALANVNLSTTETLGSLTTFNSLRLDNGGGVALNYVPLTLDSGGLLVLAGNTGITGFSGVSYLTTTSNREVIIHNLDDITLAIPVAGTTGQLTKSGSGMLTLTAGNVSHGTVMVNDGILKLGGGDQTLQVNRAMFVNEGGTLDLFGTVQNIAYLESRQSAALARNDTHVGGGTVINTSTTTQAVLSMTTASSVFAGTIGNGHVDESNIAVARSTAAGASTDWNLYTNQTYTGPTLLNGGRTILNNGARLSATSSIEITNASLLINSNNGSSEPAELTDRINDAAPILLRGSMLQLRSLAAIYTTETFGAVTLGGGNIFIDFAEGATAVNQVDATFASLTQLAGSRATVRFLNIDATPNDDQRLLINTLNGVATANIGDGLTNNLIGGWATFEREFASYIPGMGVGGLNTQGFAGYSPNVIQEGTATDNIRILLPATGSTTLLTGNVTINSFNMQASTTATGDSTLNLGGHTLTLASGGLILSPVATTALLNSINVVNGSLTAGTTSDPADLYMNVLAWFNGQADNTGNADVRVDASIVDNSAGGPVTLVVAGNIGRGTLVATNDVILTGNNTYTGGTFINSGQIRLNNTTADGLTNFAVPGDLTITGGYSTNAATLFNDRNTTVIMDSANQISHAATATLMGGAILNLNNFNQTLAALVFDNTGGTTPQVTTGTGTLTLDGNITAHGQNTGSTSQIDGKLKFTAATATITVNPVQWNSTVLSPLLPNLTINAPIEGGNIVKAGDGVLRLSGANAFSGSLDLQAGGILLGNNNALSSGLLMIGNNTFLSSTADNRVVANSFNISGDFALRDIFNLTMSGAGLLAAGNHNIGVDSATKILTLSGILTGADGTSGITKTGNGILVLGNNSNSYGGATTVADGVLRYGAVNAIPTGSAVAVLEGASLDITTGGTAVTVGSLAGNSATQGGLVFHGATSGTLTLTAGGNGSDTSFGGVIANAAGSTLNLVKIGGGSFTLGGSNLYNGSTAVVDGRLVARSVGGGSPLGTSQSLILGGGSTSGILQLGDSSAPLDHTFTSLASQGSGTANQIVSGNASMATLTLDIATATLFFGNVGGAGTNEANLNLVKNGVGDLSFAGTGTSAFVGSTTVNGGKLFMNTPGAFSATTTSLTLADGTEFSLRGTTNTANQIYGFSGTGNKITAGTTTGATLGFALDGGFNSQINLAAGQTMTVNGTLTTAVYVNSAPVSLQDYVLINGADAASLHAGAGAFDLNPVIFNGGSFTYALRFASGINGGGLDQWVLTPTAVPSAPDTWWKGDLTGLGAGVWSATTTAGVGFPSNWDTDQGSGTDALVPPDLNSIVHFSATGAANFATTLGAHMTIQELVFHTGNAPTTIGTSNGVNTLTLGNTVAPSGITLQTGVGNVGISVNVILAQHQSWNIEDTIRVLNLSGGLAGAFNLTVNDTVTNAGSLLISGAAGSLAGMLSMNAGSLIFEDTGSLATSSNVMLGTATTAATLRVGSSSAATNAIIGGLSNGVFAGSKVIGGNATVSTLTIGAASGTSTFSGALGGAGTNENQFNLIKAGAGTQILAGAATYSGTTTVNQGTLQLGAASTFAPTGALSVIANAGTTATFDFNGKSFTTVGVMTLGGGASGIAQILDTNGTKGVITLGGDIVFDALNDPGAAIVSVNLVGTGGNRTITVGESVNAANDLTLNGTYTVTSDNSLSFAGAGSGVINGNISIAPTGGATSSRDVNFNSTGAWTINAKIEVGDDILINTGVINATAGESLDATDDVVIDGTGTQGSAIVNISSAAQVHTGDDFFIRNGGVVNVLTSGGIGTGTDQLLVGDTASASAAAAGVLNLVNADISIGANGLLVGSGTNIGNITGSGVITTAGTKQLGNGSIEAGITLAGNGAITKNSTGTLTFFGERDVASTGATNLQEGSLILDYSLNNNSKIGRVFSIGLVNNAGVRSLTINGSSSASTSESVTSTTILPGSTTVAVNNGAGQTAALNLNAITRTQTGGLIFFGYSSTDAKVTSTSPAGTLGWATLVAGAGLERFAAINNVGDIVQATFTTQNNVDLWLTGQDIINSAAFTGVVDCGQISTLTFAASVASTVNIASGGHLRISNGGILVDSAVGAFDMKILGGELYGSLADGLGEIIVHQNNIVGTLTIGSNIVNSGGITKTGGGRLILSGNNTFRHVGSRLQLDEGTVQLSGSSLLGGSTMSLVMRAGTVLDLNNTAQVLGHLATTTGSLTLAFGTSGQLTLNQTANTTYTGVFTGGASSLFTINNFGFNFNINATTTTGFTGSVVINSGLLQLSVNGRLANASAFTINKSGNLLLDNNGTTISGARILDTATITLNSADGVFNGETRPRGLGLRTDQNTTTNTSETVGAIAFASGASYAFMDNSGGTSSRVNIIASNYLRTNSATFDIRGRNLGDTSTSAAWSQFRIAAGANQTAFISGNLVGGGGTAGGTAKNVSIVPWAIGEYYTGANLGDTNMGNTLVTYVADVGFKPLNLTNEYNTYAAASVSDNVRESLTADLAGLAGKTVNSLVIHKNSTGAGTINVTGAGAGETLVNTSGTFLFTQNTGAAASSVHSVILGGFDGGIQTGSSNEYVFFVVNPSSAATTAVLTARVTSPLNSLSASLTKSGRGTLEFTAVNTYAGGTTVNEGSVLVHQTGNLGTGGVTLAGGTLQIAADFAGTLDTPTVNVLAGGGTVDVLAANVVASDVALTGTGTLTKIGTGTLQIAGTTASTHTGDVGVRRGTLELNKTAGVDAISGSNLLIGFSTTTNETATVKLLADNQINNATNVSVRSATTGAVGTFDLNDHQETIGSLTAGATTGSGVLVRTGASGVLTVAGNITLNNDRNTDDTGTNPRGVVITGTGSIGTAAPNTGTLDLGGATRTITVEAFLTTTTNAARPDATIETAIRNGGVIKEGSRVLYLSGDNTYTGGTTINNGGVELTGNLASGAVTVSKTAGSLTDAAVLSGAGDGVTTGIIGGPVTLGEVDGGVVCGVGILNPGLTTSPTVNTNGALTITAGGTALTVNDGSQVKLGITSATVVSTGLIGALGDGTALNALDYLQNVGAGEIAAWNANAGNRDYINLSGASSSLSIGTRASGAFGDGSVVVSGAGLTPQYGQVFNLIDWTGLVSIGGTFGTGSSSIYDATTSVMAGDLDLSALGAGFGWDVSAFAQYGVIVVVPEPSRVLLLLLGLLGVMLRRRRRTAVVAI